MKLTKALFCVLTSMGALALRAEPTVWKLDPAHSSAEFAVRHMGISTVRGAFTKVNGAVTYDPANPAASKVDVTIDAASVDTRVEMRDNDLKSDHYFDVQKYPNITFKSSAVQTTGAGRLKITGDLTLHGVTKPVVLDVENLSEPTKDPKGVSHMGASATTAVKRSDFGMTNGLPMVGDEIRITIDTELKNGDGRP